MSNIEPNETKNSDETLEAAGNISSSVLFMIVMLCINELILSKLKYLTKRFPRPFRYFPPTTVTTTIGNNFILFFWIKSIIN